MNKPRCGTSFCSVMTDIRHDINAPARRDEIEGEGAIRGTARMEAFADGVFAIAFTLPIVGIAFPGIDPWRRRARQ